jgi:hypothetical protein
MNTNLESIIKQIINNDKLCYKQKNKECFFDLANTIPINIKKDDIINGFKSFYPKNKIIFINNYLINYNLKTKIGITKTGILVRPKKISFI